MVISNWLDAYHEGAVLDASAAAVVCAVARLVVYVIEDHPRRVLRVAERVELPVGHLLRERERRTKGTVRDKGTVGGR